MRKRLLQATMLLLAAASLTIAAEAQNAANTGAPDARTFAIFLFPDYSWLQGDQLVTVQALHDQFGTFSRAIGPRNTAIWLQGNNAVTDVEKSMKYCRRFGLAFIGGPYIVFSQIQPDVFNRAAHDKYYISLDGMTRDGALRMLTRLTEELASGSPNRRILLLAELKERLVATLTRMNILDHLFGERENMDGVLLASLPMDFPVENMIVDETAAIPAKSRATFDDR